MMSVDSTVDPEGPTLGPEPPPTSDADPEGRDDAPVAAPRAASARARRAWTLAFACSVVAAAAVTATPVLAVAPYATDDWRLDRAVRVAMLDWRDFGLEAGRERLSYEIDHLGIGPQVGDDSCTFDGRHDARSIQCAWGVTMVVPFAERSVPVRFRSHVELTGDGSLR